MQSAKFYAVATLLLITFIACNKAKDNVSNETQKIQFQNIGIAKTEEKRNDIYTADSTEAPEPQKNTTQKSAPKNIDWDKKIIKTAHVALELKDYNAFNKSIHQTVKKYGAYVASEEQTQNNYSLENTITIKVPVEQFEDLMNTLGGDGIKVIERKINSEDVTAEVLDNKGRVEAKKEVRQQYLLLLKQAKTMKDILEVQTEINTVTEELESASGRVKYLSHQAAYSTIHLKYFQYTNPQQKPDEEPGFFSKIREAFLVGVNGIASFIIGLIGIWPLLIFITLIIFIFRKWNSNKVLRIKNTD